MIINEFQHNVYRVSVYNNVIAIHMLSLTNLTMIYIWPINQEFEIDESEIDVIKLLQKSEWFDMKYNNQNNTYNISLNAIEKLRIL